MVMFLALHPMEFMFLNSSDLLTKSSHVANFNTRNKRFSNKAIGIIAFAILFFPNFTADTMISYLNSILESLAQGAFGTRILWRFSVLH